VNGSKTSPLTSSGIPSPLSFMVIFKKQCPSSIFELEIIILIFPLCVYKNEFWSKLLNKILINFLFENIDSNGTFFSISISHFISDDSPHMLSII